MRIALIQQSAGSDIESNTRRGMHNLEMAAREGADLVVFPELAFLPFFPQIRKHRHAAGWSEPIPGPTVELFSKLAARLGVVVVLNLFERDASGKTYDSSPVLDSDGRLLGTTRMVHILDAPCFHERDYYTPGDLGAPVFETSIGRLGVAICYDRHFPEYMRALAVKGADIVVVPQAGAVDEWPPGLFEAEMCVASFQNGYYTALANRVGEEECLTFAGESFVADPEGRVVARAGRLTDEILYADLDMQTLDGCHARRHFLVDRREGLKL